MTTAFLFPGQGSQSIGMGADLFPIFPELVEEANQILGYSIEEVCLSDDSSNLNLTNFTQPALYVVSCFSAKLKIQNGIVSSYAAGHSVGEFAALYSAGAFSFRDGLEMVAKRGKIMAKVSGGAMAAVIGLDNDSIEGVLLSEGADQIDLANYNSPGQIVISGAEEQIAKVLAPLKKAGARVVVPLKVSGAFHSRLMRESANEFAEFIAKFSFKLTSFPVFSNVTAIAYNSAASIPELLVKQIYSPVRWTDVVQGMRKNGVDNFVECGPGNVLTKLLRQIP